MKALKLILICLSITFLQNLTSQSKLDSKLVDKKSLKYENEHAEKKMIALEKETISQKKLIWYEDFQEALVISKEEKKPVMMYFTQKDWGKWSIRLQKEVFLTAEFKDWATENVVLLELNYPREKHQSEKLKKQNSSLQAFSGVRVFPSIIFAEINEKGKIEMINPSGFGYVKGGSSAWISKANKILAEK
jgi:protein disulfide-isomerase